jgi:hypothetical protein
MNGMAGMHMAPFFAPPGAFFANPMMQVLALREGAGAVTAAGLRPFVDCRVWVADSFPSSYCRTCVIPTRLLALSPPLRD